MSTTLLQAIRTQGYEIKLFLKSIYENEKTLKQIIKSNVYKFNP